MAHRAGVTLYEQAGQVESNGTSRAVRRCSPAVFFALEPPQCACGALGPLFCALPASVVELVPHRSFKPAEEVWMEHVEADVFRAFRVLVAVQCRRSTH